jgi:hypothetical protein
MKPLIAALGALALIAGGCTDLGSDDTRIKGSGVVVSETRDIGSFDRLAVEGSGEVIIEVGPASSIEIEAEDNVMPVLTTDISNGRLVLSVEDGNRLREIRTPIYRITTPALVGVEIAGSGDVTIDGVDAAEFAVEIAGSGRVQPTGTADRLSVSISGSGNYDGVWMLVASAEIDIAGSGSVLVNAEETLDVSIEGSGDVGYMNNPVVTQSISGDGRVYGPDSD